MNWLVASIVFLAACNPAPTDSACGGCPDGATCGAANGIPVCRDEDSGVPRFDHVFVVMMENTSTSTLLASDAAPYVHSLIDQGAFSDAYFGVEHPSLPNYLELFSGLIEDNGPRECDCEPEGPVCEPNSCSILDHACGCPQPQPQLVDLLEDAGRTWRAYAESMGAPCNLVEDGLYAPKHVPFLYFPSLTDDAARCEDHVVDYTAFAGDVAAGPRDLSYVAPNLVNDMHDPVVGANEENRANGDAFLAAEIPQILASPAYTERGLLVIVWDENDYSGLLDPNEPIPMILLSPLARQGGFRSDRRYDHDDLLALFSDGLGVERLGNAVGADPLRDFFPAE